MYGDVVDGQSYWDERDYTGTVTLALLLKATTFIDGIGWRMTKGGNVVPRFPGRPTSPTQTDQWPRIEAEDIYGNVLTDDEVPGAVIRATYEAAFHEHENPGALDFTLRADENIAREQYGDVSFSYFFISRPGVPQTGLLRSAPVIPSVMAAIAPVLTGGGGNVYGITGVVA